MADNLITFQMQQGIHAKFTPQPDITAYELAQLLPYLFGSLLTEPIWEKLGTTTRHMERVPNPPPVHNWESSIETRPKGVVE